MDIIPSGKNVSKLHYTKNGVILVLVQSERGVETVNVCTAALPVCIYIYIICMKVLHNLRIELPNKGQPGQSVDVLTC